MNITEEIRAMVLQGEKAERILGEILADKDEAVVSGEDSYQSGEYPAPYVSGYYQENGAWVAFDNTNHHCWVEEFATEALAKEYATNTE